MGYKGGYRDRGTDRGAERTEALSLGSMRVSTLFREHRRGGADFSPYNTNLARIRKGGERCDAFWISRFDDIKVANPRVSLATVISDLTCTALQSDDVLSPGAGILVQTVLGLASVCLPLLG